jgi:hypothetical protein
MTPLVIDRHVLASNASSYNTAWQTFGWTPALAGPRSSRLEEHVPWATLAARAEAPARLAGAYHDVVAAANFDRLQFASLPLDGRHGFSVWGAIGERRNGEWRVVTHTLLFDDDAFDVMAGFPQGLLTIPAYAAWFSAMVEEATFAEPAALPAISLPRTRATRTAFENARRDEIVRLRTRLVALSGGAHELETQLAGVLEALARVRGGGPIRHVGLRDDGNGHASLLVRLAWTALPLADRADTSFVTEQRRTDAPRATLLGLPEAEWGQYAPPNTRLLDPARLHAGDVSAGRREWARSVAGDGGEAHERLGARVDARRWRVVGRDDVRALASIQSWRQRWVAGSDRAGLARELLALEAAGEVRAAGRMRAAAHVAALASMDARDPAAVLIDAFRPYPSAAIALVRAAVRTLARRPAGGRALALRLRCEAIEPPALVPVDELFRLLERETWLVEAAREPEGARHLFRAAVTAGCAGHVAAERLLDAAVPALSDPMEEVVRIAAGRNITDPRVARTLAHATAGVLGAHARETPAPLVAFAARSAPGLLLEPALLDVLLGWCEAHAATAGPRSRVGQLVTDLGVALLHALRTAAADGATRERVLRVLWLEHHMGAERAAARFSREADDALAVLVPLLVAPAPLPLFLSLRRLARGMTPNGAAERLRPWLPELEEYCPSLHERLRRGAAGVVR